MTNEEIRLRAILANRTGDVRYVIDIPRRQQYAGLYPDIMFPLEIGPDGKKIINEIYIKRKEKEEEDLKLLKEKLDKELNIK
jgi:hypothetical protein